MANILKEIVGPWGAAFINIGLIISILGCWLSWTMLPAETTMQMAEFGLLPKKWCDVNKKNAPTYSLVGTAILTNLFLLTFLVTDYAYEFAYSLCTAAIIICYLLVGIYQMIYSYQQKDYKQFAIGFIAALFQATGILLAGLSYLLLCSIMYVPGFYFYIRARRENQVTKISRSDKITLGVISILAVIAIALLITGTISV